MPQFYAWASQYLEVSVRHRGAVHERGKESKTTCEEHNEHLPRDNEQSTRTSAGWPWLTCHPQERIFNC
eukprot:6172911-Pleurochrysis_carterae.AAC.3